LAAGEAFLGEVAIQFELDRQGTKYYYC